MAESVDLKFAPDEEAAILRHMNGDHADDAVIMCRGLGGQPSTEAARTVAVDRATIHFEATVAGQPMSLAIPWARPITARGEVRAEVVRIYRESCEILGITPRESEGG